MYSGSFCGSTSGNLNGGSGSKTIVCSCLLCTSFITPLCGFCHESLGTFSIDPIFAWWCCNSFDNFFFSAQFWFCVQLVLSMWLPSKKHHICFLFCSNLFIGHITHFLILFSSFWLPNLRSDMPKKTLKLDLDFLDLKNETHYPCIQARQLSSALHHTHTINGNI